MVQVAVSMDLSKVRDLMRFLSPEERGRRAHGAMNESLAYLQGQVQKNFPKDTGIGRGSVFTEINGAAIEELTGTVASPEEHAVVLEMGRRPGQKMPPPGALLDWVHRHRIAGTYSVGKSRRRRGDALQQYWEDLEAAFMIARKIGKRGLPAHHMFKNAADQGKDRVSRIWAKWFRY